MNEWPNNPETFRQLYLQHLGEYGTLFKRRFRSAAEDDLMRQLRQKLVLMEKSPWARGLAAVA